MEAKLLEIFAKIEQIMQRLEACEQALRDNGIKPQVKNSLGTAHNAVG